MIYRGQSPLKNITNYRIYYGRVDDETLEGMKKYDMVVVEALRFDAAMVERLHQAGVMVIGYISVSEVGHWDDAILDVLGKSDFLYSDGKAVMNASNKLGDLKSIHYRTVLLNTIEKRIRSKGMDGIFFDTVDSIDVVDLEDKRLEQAYGYIKLIEDIRVKWEDAILIQNRGFRYTHLLERGMIDALLWENFSEDKMSEKVYQRWAVNFRRMRWFKNIRPMVLSYRNEAESKAYADKNNWLFSYLPGQAGLMDWKLE